VSLTGKIALLLFYLLHFNKMQNKPMMLPLSLMPSDRLSAVYSPYIQTPSPAVKEGRRKEEREKGERQKEEEEEGESRERGREGRRTGVEKGGEREEEEKGEGEGRRTVILY
jgi:hypothetical protein